MTASVTDRAQGFETESSEALAGVDLVFELNVSAERYRCARDHLGAMMSEVPSGAHIALLMRFPALTIAGLVGHARLRPSGADYWTSFWSELGRDRDKSFEDIVCQLFGDMLGQFALKDVPGLRETSVVPLLDLHAGLDDESVGAVIDAVERHIAAGHEPRGTALLDRVTEPGFAHRRSRLPDRFWMLLQHAPSVAVTVLDRITDMLVATVAAPTTWDLASISPTTADLPVPVLDAAVARLSRRPFLGGVPDAAALCAGRFPALRWNETDGEVRLVIPGGPNDAVWRVWSGAAPEQVAVPADGAATLPLGAAVREIVLIDLDSGARRVVPTFHPTDPIVVFGADGRACSRFDALPAAEVTVLVPRDVDVVAHDRTKITVVDSGPAPWDGWEIRTLDLAGQRDLRLIRDGRPGRTRRILPAQTPAYALPEPIVGVTTRTGEPVYGERPLVDLPIHEGEETKEWRVRVRRVGQLEWLVDYPWASADYVTSADPFDGLDEPLVGRFEIAAGDSYGLDLRQTVVLAEGLDAAHDPAFRLPQADGLTTSTSELTAGDGLEVEHEVLDFGPHDTERAVTVSADGSELALTVRPPHAQIRFEHPGRPSIWQTRLPEIGIDDSAAGRLTVRIPGALDVTFALLDADGEIVREWDADERAGTEFTIATRSVADAAKRLLRGSLVALIEDENGDSDEAEVALIVRTAEATVPNAVDHTGDLLTAAWLMLDATPLETVVEPDPDAEPAPAADEPSDHESAADDPLLVADPTASLLALGDSPVAPSRIPALLIRSGLAERVFDVPTESGGAHPNPYISCTLATGAVVDPDAQNRDGLQSYLASRGGEDLLRLIASGRMSDPRTGVFDRNVLAVDQMAREQVETLFERFRIVPGPLVDVDMRTAATIEAFHRRTEWMADPVSNVAPRFINKTLRDVRRASPELYDLIAARNEALDGVDTIRNPWMLLSMQSLAFAALGRLQAYGRLKQPVLDDAARIMWARLADYCPAMVAADLLIANAVAVRADALDKVRAQQQAASAPAANRA